MYKETKNVNLGTQKDVLSVDKLANNIIQMKNIYYFFLTFLPVLFCCSCGRTTPKESESIVMESMKLEHLDNDTASYFSIHNNTISIDFEKPAQVSVFDYFKSVELIPLETNNDVLISLLRKMIYHQGRYYILDRYNMQHIVFVFDQQGKFIFKIDKRGQGPGEYPFLDDIHINPFTGHLELLCAFGFVYEYDLSGKYISTIHRVTNDYLRAVHEFIPLDKNTTLFYAAFHHPFRLVYYDRTKEEITHEAYHESDASDGVKNLGSVMIISNFYAYKGDWHFYRPLDRQIYKIKKDTIEVAYTWDFGKFNRDVKKARFSNSNLAWNILHDEIYEQFPYMIFETGENNRYVIANVKWKGGDFVNVLFDKSAQQGLFIKKFTESVTIRPYIVTNEYVLSHCNPGELEQYITEGMLDEHNLKIFNELIHSDANPIIIKYNFK
jgi:hypothetical protein